LPQSSADEIPRLRLKEKTKINSAHGLVSVSKENGNKTMRTGASASGKVALFNNPLPLRIIRQDTFRG